jgi:hypothetical protein
VHTRLSCFPGQTDTTPEEDTDIIVVSEPAVEHQYYYSESGCHQDLVERSLFLMIYTYSEYNKKIVTV